MAGSKSKDKARNVNGKATRNKQTFNIQTFSNSTKCLPIFFFIHWRTNRMEFQLEKESDRVGWNQRLASYQQYGCLMTYTVKQKRSTILSQTKADRREKIYWESRWIYIFLHFSTLRKYYVGCVVMAVYLNNNFCIFFLLSSVLLHFRWFCKTWICMLAPYLYLYVRFIFFLLLPPKCFSF